MKTSSAKAKGRRGQQEVRDDLYTRIYGPAGLELDDCKSTPMGSSGLDIQLSPAARKVLDLAVEVKVTESLNVSTTFWKHYKKYENTSALKLLAFRKNRTDMAVTLRWEDFLNLLERGIADGRKEEHEVLPTGS